MMLSVPKRGWGVTNKRARDKRARDNVDCCDGITDAGITQANCDKSAVTSAWVAGLQGRPPDGVGKASAVANLVHGASLDWPSYGINTFFFARLVKRETLSETFRKLHVSARI